MSEMAESGGVADGIVVGIGGTARGPDPSPLHDASAPSDGHDERDEPSAIASSAGR